MGTLRLVARHADGCNVFGDPEEVRHKVAVLHRHCDVDGRDPAEIEQIERFAEVIAAFG